MHKILLADPNTPFATVVGEVLCAQGAYSVSLAATSAETRQLCAQLQPDLVVLDADLPDCPPEQFIAELRAHTPGLPVIYLPYNAGGLPAGADVQGVLVKPFFLPDLPDLIVSILGPSEPAPEVRAAPQAQSLMPRAWTPPPRPRPTTPVGPITLNLHQRTLLEGHVQALSHAVRGEPVMLTQGMEVIAVAPRLSQSAGRALAEIVAKAQSAGHAEMVRFEGDSDSTRYMLYSIPVASDLALSVALRVRLPLPVLRKLTRETAEHIADVLRGDES